MKQERNEYRCPVATTLRLIGGKYKALILWHLMDESVLRFSELRRLIPDATAKVLTQQLRELEEDKLVVCTVYPVVPPKVEYTLTDRGKSLRAVLCGMYDWGEAQMVREGVAPNCTMAQRRASVGANPE